MVGLVGVGCATVRFADQIGRGLAHGEMDLPDVLLAMYQAAPSADALIENVVAHVRYMDQGDQTTLVTFVSLLGQRLVDSFPPDDIGRIGRELCNG